MMGFKKNTPGGNAGCDACRVLSGLGIAHVGRIRRLRRIRQPLLITAYEKIVIQHIQMRGTPGEIWCALLRASERVVILLNWAIGG